MIKYADEESVETSSAFCYTIYHCLAVNKEKATTRCLKLALKFAIMKAQ